MDATKERTTAEIEPSTVVLADRPVITRGWRMPHSTEFPTRNPDDLRRWIPSSSDVKWCPICQQERPKTEFHKDHNRGDGLGSLCKTCKRFNARLLYRKSISKRARVNCHYCGIQLSDETYSTDHIVPKTRGGGNEPSNLVPCCLSCNSSKHNFDLEEWREIKRRQRDGVPWFSPHQLAYLREYGIELPKGEPFLFWFEEVGQ